MERVSNRPFPSSRRALFQNEGRCSAFDLEVIFHCHANKMLFLTNEPAKKAEKKKKAGCTMGSHIGGIRSP